MLARTIPPGEYVPDADQRVVMHGVPWSHYEVMLALRGEASVPRISYLEGSLELMSPSRTHQSIKSTIGRLVEAHALDAGIEFGIYGSWTLKNPAVERGAEPDECYIVGADQQKDRPDLAIEVIWTSGGLDKLEIYRRLGVAEVWTWREGAIQVHQLRGDDYARSEKSSVFPALDLTILARHAELTPASRAIREFRLAHPR